MYLQDIDWPILQVRACRGTFILVKGAASGHYTCSHSHHCFVFTRFKVNRKITNISGHILFG